MPPASSTWVLLLRLKTFPFATRAPSQEVSGAEWSPWRHSLDRRKMLIEPPLTAGVQHQFAMYCLREKALQLGGKICNNEGWNLNFSGYLLSNKNVLKSQWISGVLDRHFFWVGLHNTRSPCKPFVQPYKLSLLSKCHQKLEGSVTGAPPSALLLLSFPKVGGVVNKRKLCISLWRTPEAMQMIGLFVLGYQMVCYKVLCAT